MHLSAALATQGPPAHERSFGQWLLDLAQAPGVAEGALAAIVLGAVLLFWLRLLGLVRNARSRQALADYLLGVEQALHGDLDGAHARLQSVVANDPENHFARLMLGKVLAERGQAEQAHQQHVCLKTAFGIDSPENDLMLAQSLMLAGLPQEAADAAQRALAKAPDRAGAWDFVYRARLQCGDFEGAQAAGKQLLSFLRGTKQAQLATDLARTLAQAGAQRLQRGDAAGAKALDQEARRLGGSDEAVALLEARLAAASAGVNQTVQALLGNATPNQALVPTGAPTAWSATRGLPVATIGGLIPAARWFCRACQAPLPDAVGECARCLAAEPACPMEPRLCADLSSPLLAMDAIDVNDAHVQRLVQVLLTGAGDERASAPQELLELREVAVLALLRAAWHGSTTVQDIAIETLRAMGPTIAPSLFAASDQLGAERILPLGTRSPGALVGRVVQGFDRSALPHVEPLFASAKAEHRKILIDFFLGLHDLEQFQLVLERFPPMEILHRLNKADTEVLTRFLQAVPKGHFVAESLLCEETFYRDEELLAAIPGASDPDVLRQVMRTRGPTRSAIRVLIAALGTEPLAEVAETVLADLGPGVLDHVLAAFADPERGDEERRRLRRVLVRIGGAAAAAVCDSFGPEPTAFDEELRTILVGIGDGAVVPLQAAYEHSGWLEKVSLGLISRHTNRRVQIVLALKGIGTANSVATLRELAGTETDANLRLRLEQALHEITAGRDASAGRGGAP